MLVSFIRSRIYLEAIELIHADSQLKIARWIRSKQVDVLVEAGCRVSLLIEQQGELAKRISKVPNLATAENRTPADQGVHRLAATIREIDEWTDLNP